MKSKAFEPCCFEMESGSLKTGYCQLFEEEFPAKSVFDQLVTISADLLWLGTMDTLQLFKQLGYRCDGVHPELACLQSYSLPEQGWGPVSLSQVTCVFC